MANVMKFYGFEFSSSNSTSPELSGAQTCFKGTLTIANIVFLIFGAVLCGVGAYAMQTKAGGLAGETLPTGIIVMGVFIILVSFLGCMSAYKESRCLLGIYFGFLLIFVIILFAVGIAVYAANDQAEKYMVEGWCAASVSVIHDIQNYFVCSGLYRFNDSQTHYDSSGTLVTAGCVHVNGRDIKIDPPTGMYEWNGLPCLPMLESTFQSSYVAAGASAIAFACIMTAGMIVVCVLMSGIKEKRHLEDIRKLHRKLREAKEAPTSGGLRDLGGGDEGVTMDFNEVDLNPAEPLDHDVELHVDDVGGNFEEEHAVANYVPGQSTFKAQPPVKISKKKKSRQPEPEPEPEYEEQPYEEEQTSGGYAPQPDEYDEED